jgi:hypothetical protein
MARISPAFMLLAALALALVPGCSGGHRNADKQARRQASFDPADPTRLASLTGLYQSAGPAPASQMCIVPTKHGGSRFGLVIWGGNYHSCSGSGAARRAGDRLFLTMAGESACRVEAKIAGSNIVFPGQVAPGCSYYCGARATLAGARLAQRGAGRAEAMKATDLVGEPLCVSEG